MSDLEGGCACGAIRYRLTAPFFAVGLCHCRGCQYASGGGPNYVGLAPKGSLEVLKGHPKTYVSKGGSGGDVSRIFCGDCGTPLFSDSPAAAFAPVKLGSLDDPAAAPGPSLHIWTESAPPWHNLDDGLPAFPRNPPG